MNNETIIEGIVTTREVSTKVNKDSDAVETSLTLNWSGMTLGDIIALAERQVIIDAQVEWRKEGIPAGAHTLECNEYRLGQKRGPRKPVSAEAALNKLPEAERIALVRAMMEKYGLA